MVLRASHTTTYLYSEPVSICHTEVHLTPRPHWAQTLLDHEIEVSPAPDFSLSRHDYFGNEVAYFSIHEPHQTLTITSRSLVDVAEGLANQTAATPAWEQVRDDVRKGATDEAFEASQFVYESSLVHTSADFRSFAAESFLAGKPLLESATDLSHRIFTGFRYDKRVTTVSTPVDQVLRDRQGVCQDFAHFMIACLRSLGLAARYVSGYLRSGKNVTGSEASHAWVSVFSPGLGWLDLDPTNDVTPAGNHITVAWGRDYSDVTPVKGVALGGGEQVIAVKVEVVPDTGNRQGESS
jgi:transglutaminase-like putative cysteine protease